VVFLLLRKINMIEQISLAGALKDGAKEVFETMIFIDLDENLCELTIDGDALLSSISFKGDLEGVLSVSCTRECAIMLAANMLALDPGDPISDEEISDAMGEVANMVMGSFKARMLDTVNDINVSIPNVVSGRKLENSLGEGCKLTKKQFNIDQQYMIEFSVLTKEANQE
jgi:chemotaxis protein CheX